MAESDTPSTASQFSARDAELHYKSLTDSFKFLVTLIGIGFGLFATAGVYLGYKDMSAMKAEVKQNLSDIKADVRQNMSDVKSDTKSIVENARDDAKTSIENTKTSTDAQIAQLRDRSAAIALSEAQRRVDEAFHNRNIEGMVENAATRQVAPVIERQLRTEVDRAMTSVQDDIAFIGRLADAGSYLRGGARAGLDKLIALQKNAPNENMRVRASSLLQSIGDDYEKFTLGDRKNVEVEAVQGALSEHANDLKRFSEAEKRERLIPILIKEIQSSDDLQEVTNAFLALRSLTRQRFHVFDIDAVEGWCKEHTTQCQ